MLRVLHLEDCEHDRELIRAALNDQGIEHESHWATTKALFTAVLDKMAVDVVLCDSGGPGFDGKEALALVRSRQPQAVFIYVTGHSKGAVFDALNRSGADGAVSKTNLPVVAETIVRALKARGRDLPTKTDSAT
jgi:DNA-binding NarL/FixJ family response regulator